MTRECITHHICDCMAERLKRAEAELHFKACLVRDLLPYQERAVKAEAERDALRKLLREIAADPRIANNTSWTAHIDAALAAKGEGK